MAGQKRLITKRNKKIIFFHIGYHKTGTTALQSLLYRNREKVAEKGVFLPNSVSLPNGNCALLYAHLIYKKRPELIPLGLFERVQKNNKELTKELVSEINKTDLHKVFISSEGFSKMVMTRYTRRKMKSLLRPYRKYTTKVVITLRHPIYYIESLYNQAIKEGAYLQYSFLTPQEFIDKVLDDKMRDYYYSLKWWEKRVGRMNLIVREYDGKKYEGMYDDFSKILGINFDDLDYSVLRKNDRLENCAVNYKSRINKYVLSGIQRLKERRKLNRMIVNCLNETHNKGYKTRIFSDSQADRIQKKYSAMNEKLRKRYSLSFSDREYEEYKELPLISSSYDEIKAFQEMFISELSHDAKRLKKFKMFFKNQGVIQKTI